MRFLKLHSLKDAGISKQICFTRKLVFFSIENKVEKHGSILLDKLGQCGLTCGLRVASLRRPFVTTPAYLFVHLLIVITS